MKGGSFSSLINKGRRNLKKNDRDKIDEKIIFSSNEKKKNDTRQKITESIYRRIDDILEYLSWWIGCAHLTDLIEIKRHEN